MLSIGRARLLALAAGGCLCLGASSAVAGSSAIGCGTTLTTSTTLTADILHCTGTALVVGANGITVNLAGHTISGTNAPGSEGIADDGHAGVQIVGSGKITDFRLNGVGMRKAPNSVVRGLTIRRIGAGGKEGEPGSAGIAILDSPGSQVVGNDVANDVKAYQADGTDVINSRGTVVRGNSLSHNSWDGLVLIKSPGGRITANHLDANGNNGTEVNGSDAATVTGNAAAGNKAAGIVVGAAQKAHVAGNTARGNDTGIFFFDLHASLISKNNASGNRAGLELTGGQSGSDGNRLTGNTANRNRETGIGVEDGADNNIVSGNTANENQGKIGDGGGIFVQAGNGNQLTNNVANANHDSGIIIVEKKPGDTSGNLLKGNTANKNRGRGIDAISGSVDGGGNRASGNATSPQCQNVNCTG